jgi:hypothetical protein
VEPTVADGEIELSIRPPAQTMQVMTQESGIHSKPSLNDRPFIGNPVSICIPQAPQIGDAGEEYITVRRHHPCGQAVQYPIEVGSENG